MTIKKILLPTDGSDYSKTALQYGIYIRRIVEAQLTGLHIVDIKIIQGPVFNDIFGSVSLSPYPEFLTAIEEGLNERADAILAGFREQCVAAGFSPEVKKVTGIIDDEIIEESKNADLIILAQRGEHFPISRSILLGSTAGAVVRKSGKPVLITPEHFKEIEAIGLAYDGSRSAGNALKIAAELSSKARWPLTSVIIAEDQHFAEELRRKIEDTLAPYDIDKEILVLQGREEKEIIKFINEGAVEMMLMGAYGHSRFKEFFLGSTTSYVIRNSRIPVLLTR